ncbi:NotI family restriction endonuclease [Caulobacter sp. 17J80-11]|uniref:NotI family restriction endonuclease n=1 Tax=Caulobacter sp. 17J80-11 TaxID=2763502 RepID=UPI001653CC8A|nr:NotI family restriction endonuclease [Caulobacter sp. 17J80-11]MBC6983791.1 hypothetical protein [Caulobacter sp. 17J80-11]
MTKIVDLFGFDTTAASQPNWEAVVSAQRCPFVDKRCYKVRKSQSEVSIGTCTVQFGAGPVVICPLRLLEKQKIFLDCLHLLTGHEPGNELHIVSEVGIPGGSLDYILASIRGGKVRDFVGIELQTLDTTGTVWPERQRFIATKGIPADPMDTSNTKSYGMNWKMTAKTILVQLHHKLKTFEVVNKHLVLVVQDRLMEYMVSEFQFGHLNSARVSDPMHFHPYSLNAGPQGHSLELGRRFSTDIEGIATCLGLQNEAKLDLAVIHGLIEKKITERTRLSIYPPQALAVDPQA